MKSTVMIGIILIVLGAIGLAIQGISYTTREKVVDLPGLQVTSEKEKTVPIPAIAGGIALLGGVGIIMAESLKSRL